jgi:ammonia channel protein AmtB
MECIWVLTSTACPAYDEAGVARFYGGLVQSKQFLGTIMQSVVMPA